MSYLTTLPNSLQIFGIWHTKKHLTTGVSNVSNQKNDFLFDFSLSSHFFNWFFLSLLTICFSLPTNVLSLPLSSSDQIPSSSSTLTSNVFLSLCTSNQTQINFLLLSLSSGRVMDWVVIGWDSRWVSWVEVFDRLLVEFWVWVVELVVILVLGGFDGFGFLLVLEVGCGVDGSDQT